MTDQHDTLSSRLSQILESGALRGSPPGAALARKVIEGGLGSLTANEQATYEADILPLMRRDPRP